MKDFFTYFTDIKHIDLPIQVFSLFHLFILGIGFTVIILIYKKLVRMHENKQNRFMIYMAFYFLIEEALYYLWIFIVCKKDPLFQMLPLHLCSVCAYMSALCVYLKTDWIRCFCAIMCIFGGLIALIYPANIDSIYPLFHYRTINFFILHFSFVLFGFMQLRHAESIQYRYIKQCMILLVLLTSVSFIVNFYFKTDYMFMQVPPTIGFIKIIYTVVGDYLFLPTAYIILGLVMFFGIYFTKLFYKIKLKKQFSTI